MNNKPQECTLYFSSIQVLKDDLEQEVVEGQVISLTRDTADLWFTF